MCICIICDLRQDLKRLPFWISHVGSLDISQNFKKDPEKSNQNHQNKTKLSKRKRPWR